MLSFLKTPLFSWHTYFDIISCYILSVLEVTDNKCQEIGGHVWCQSILICHITIRTNEKKWLP